MSSHSASPAASGHPAPAAADAGHRIAPGEIAIGVVIGRTSEFFDFFVYAIASVLVFPKLLFPTASALNGTLYSFAIFSLAFLARPFGTLIFTMIDREYGRGAKLTAALFLLGGSTAAIAFLPGYETLGSGAAMLLAALRIGQGLALGGSWDGLASLLAINAPTGKRGWYAMIPQLGAPLGLVAASLLFAFFVSALPAQDFMEWGWRYPFFVALAIEDEELFAGPLSETLRSGWRTVLMGAFAPLASFAMFHMVTVFPLSWVFLFTSESPTRFLVIEAGAAALGVVAIIISGQLADRVGRRTLLGGSAAAIAAFSGFAPQFLNGGEAGQIAFMLLGFGLLGLSFGQASGALSHSFSPQHRYTASSLTSDLAWLVGAGFAPFAALFLSSQWGLLAAGGYLLSGAAGTLIALWLNRELGRAIE